jgi:putative glutamine amidotransferase
MRPLIGITPDEGLSPERPGRPAMPRYELKLAYPDAVLAAGGAPLVLPYSPDDDVIARYLDTVRGLVVSGGAFDVSPEEYGESAGAKMGPVKPVRTRFERKLLEGALARGMPVLGVCGGMQLLNVVLGGTLVQDVGTEVPGALEHEQEHDPREAAHDIAIEPGSRLARIAGRARIGANTTHHQAVKAVGRGLAVSGRSEDGVVEAVEGTGAAFVLGVQWHPELLADDANRAIYRAFVEATR